MTNPAEEEPLEPTPESEAAESALPGPIAKGHAKMPDPLDDDALALAAARERVEMGVQDYVPQDVPPATGDLPEGASEAADLAQRGLVEDNEPDEEDAPEEGDQG